MPTYEYLCAACGHKFEEFQSIKAKPTRKCPKCGKMKVDRLLSTGAGMIFKGSGFYITDYRSEGYKNAAKADSDASGNTAASPSTPASSPTPVTAAPAAVPAPAPKTESKGKSDKKK